MTSRSMLGRLGLAATVVLGCLVLTACRGDGDSPTPTGTATATVAPETATPSATAVATPTASIEDDVAEAYLAYWAAYADAVLNLDASLVEGFATGEELESIRAEIDALERDGVALRVVVEHDFLVVMTSDTTATVVDEVTNNSFFVDATTKEPPTAEGSGEILRDQVFMERVDDRWLAVRSTRETSE